MRAIRLDGGGAASCGVAAVLSVAVFASSVSVLSVVGVTTVTSSASAQGKPAAAGAKRDDKKEAGRHFKAGKDLFEKGAWKDAREEFQKAEEIIPASQAEWYIGRCSEELGEHADAASWYQKALDSGKLKDEQAADAKSRLEALKKKPAKLRLTSDPPGATIVVDGRTLTDKTPAEIDVAPGPHKVNLQASGKKPADRDVEVVAFTGGSVDVKLESATVGVAADDTFKGPVDATTAAATDAAPPPRASTEKRDLTWVYVTGGAAIVALGVGAFFGFRTLSAHKDFDNANTNGDGPAARDARDRGTRSGLIADMGFGIGLTLALTSIVLYATSPSKDTASIKPSIALSPMIGAPRDGKLSLAGGSLSFHF